MTEAQVVIGECGCNETMVEEVVVSLALGNPQQPSQPGLPDQLVLLLGFVLA